MTREFENKVAWVTGGSSGIGRATARILGNEGARVAVSSRTVTKVEETVKLLQDAGIDALALPMDVTDPEANIKAVDAILSRWGRLDVAVLNAGDGYPRSVLEMTLAEWRWHMDLNLNSAFYGIQASANAMVRGGEGGAIVVVGSIAAINSRPGFGAYSASKSGQQGLVRGAAMDLAGHGIRVNILAPGLVETERTEGQFGGLAPAVPLGAAGDARDIGHSVVFLASRKSAYITGAYMVADGGLTLPFGPIPPEGWGQGDSVLPKDNTRKVSE